MELFRFRQGTRPLLISMPHVGTHIPDPLLRRMLPIARSVPDTDWHLEQLYDFADSLGASVLAGTHSRYVVDLNRPPDNANLYPGKDTTGLCPIDTFAKQPLYRMSEEPDETEVRHRVGSYWKPYHAKLQTELQLTREQGWALEAEEAVLTEAGVAAPIFDRKQEVIGSIGISGAVRELLIDDAPKAELVQLVLEAARHISRELGARLMG